MKTSLCLVASVLLGLTACSSQQPPAHQKSVPHQALGTSTSRPLSEASEQTPASAPMQQAIVNGLSGWFTGHPLPAGFAPASFQLNTCTATASPNVLAFPNPVFTCSGVLAVSHAGKSISGPVAVMVTQKDKTWVVLSLAPTTVPKR